MQSLWVTVCVSKCPVAGDTVLYCQPNSVVTSCLPKNSTNNTNSVEIYPSYVCKLIYIQSQTPPVCPTQPH